MIRKIFGFFAMAMVAFSCAKEMPLEDGASSGKSKKQIPEGATLYAIKRATPPKGSSLAKGVASFRLNTQREGYWSHLWNCGQTIKIKFMDNSAAYLSRRNLIKTVANEWIGANQDRANIHFQFFNTNEISNAEADVRIAFNSGEDLISWSYLGREALWISANEPTMCFANLSKIENAARGQILRMFGHMLGLHNEHSNPNAAPINWAPVIGEVLTLAEWPDELYAQFFGQYSRLSDYELVYTEPDPASIMVWPVAEWMTTDGVNIPGNSTLSIADIDFIKMLYPHSKDSVYGEPSIFTIDFSRCQNPISRYINISGLWHTNILALEFDNGDSYIGQSDYGIMFDHFEAREYVVKVWARNLEINVLGNLTSIDGDPGSQYPLIACRLSKDTKFTKIGFSNSQITTLSYTSPPDFSAVESFNGAFMFSSIKNIPHDLFARVDTSKAIDFRYAFMQCDSLRYAMPLWSKFPNAAGNACYAGSTNAGNYAQIPLSWLRL